MSDTQEVTGGDVGAVPHEWKPAAVVCPSCSTELPIHEQRPEDLLEGVWVECSACRHRFRMVTEKPGVGDGVLLECGSCHRTFTAESDPQPVPDGAGSWECPGCSSVNHHAGDSGTAESSAVRA